MQILGKLKKFIVLLGGGAILLLWPWLAQGANLLQNPGLEPPFNKYGQWTAQGHTFDLEVAHAWERFFIPAGTDNPDKLRYFRASAVEFLFDDVEKRDGQEAQLFWSTQPFEAGLYQQISGLTIGETYGFQAGVLQVYGETDNGLNNRMFRSLGLDPTGGLDPTAPTVLWGPEEGHNGNWFYPGVGGQAISSTVTVFIKVRATVQAPSLQENAVWVDDTFFDVAPTTTLTISLDAADQATATWSGTPHPGFDLFAYEAQYRPAAGSTWTDLQIFSTTSGPSLTSSRSFPVEPGQTYVVRARTWHEQDGSDSHEIPGPWVEETITVGGLVQGRVLHNRAGPLNGLTVSLATDPSVNAATANAGRYTLFTGAGQFGLTTGGSSWSIPQPVYAAVPNLAAITPLTLTLRPPDDIIRNGDFVDDLSQWQMSGPDLPSLTSSDYRTLSQSVSLSGSVTLSQTGFITGSYEPTLSFWYKLAGGDGDDLFTAEILGPGGAATSGFSATASGQWRHVWLPLALTEVYTGPVGVRFSLSQSGPTPGRVYLDEVSLGQAWGGPHKAYLPLLWR